MFKNMGKNLQLFGKILFFVGLIAWIAAIAIAIKEELSVYFILAILLCGPFLAFGLCMVFVGFGRIVELHELLLAERESADDPDDDGEFELVVPEVHAGRMQRTGKPTVQRMIESGVCTNCGAKQVKVIEVIDRDGRAIRLCRNCYGEYRAHRKTVSVERADKEAPANGKEEPRQSRKKRTLSEWIGLEDNIEEEEADWIRSVQRTADQGPLNDVNYCKQCHKPIPRDSGFCPHCGAEQD